MYTDGTLVRYNLATKLFEPLLLGKLVSQEVV
jgi:hypothetical protein